jgi:hypothetical protein
MIYYSYIPRIEANEVPTFLQLTILQEKQNYHQCFESNIIKFRLIPF